jgi:hypothetical protein
MNIDAFVSNSIRKNCKLKLQDHQFDVFNLKEITLTF